MAFIHSASTPKPFPLVCGPQMWSLKWKELFWKEMDVYRFSNMVWLVGFFANIRQYNEKAFFEFSVKRNFSGVAFNSICVCK